MSANHGKEDGIYPLITIAIEIAKHKSLFKKDAKTSKVDLCFQLIEDIIVQYKDENQSSQHLYK
jgi:hypothetical protein